MNGRADTSSTPEEFDREFQCVTAFLAETAAGKEPSYGESCAAYLNKLMGELA